MSNFEISLSCYRNLVAKKRKQRTKDIILGITLIGLIFLGMIIAGQTFPY